MVRLEIKRYKSNKLLIFLFVIILIAISLLILDNPFKKTEDLKSYGTGIKDNVPDIKFKSFDDKDVSFADYKGKALIVNSWVGWCPFCIEEMPTLQKFRDENKEDIEVIFVHRTATESVEKAKEYLNDFSSKGINITSPVVIDPNDEFYNMFFGFGMPVTLFIDKEGVIIDRKIGPLNSIELANRARELVEASVQSFQIENNIIKITDDGTKYLVEPSKLNPAGPPKDGIPSLDDPKFQTIKEANQWLTDDEFGLGVNYNNLAKFYPYKILLRHEVVNDFFANKPALITYCPLCVSGIAFERNVNDETLEFGVSGKLYNSNLVMYDRKTNSYWSQYLGKSIVGEFTGKQLKLIPSDTMTYGDWKKINSGTLVLSIDTGFPFSYDVDPYNREGYDYYTNQDIWFDNKDKRLNSKELILGIKVNNTYKAYRIEDIKSQNIIQDIIGNKSIVIFYNEDYDVVRFFNTELNGNNLKFNLIDNKIIDENTNSEWDINGNSNTSEKLSQIMPTYSFWFTWSAFHPATGLHEPKI